MKNSIITDCCFIKKLKRSMKLRPNPANLCRISYSRRRTCTDRVCGHPVRGQDEHTAVCSVDDGRIDALAGKCLACTMCLTLAIDALLPTCGTPSHGDSVHALSFYALLGLTDHSNPHFTFTYNTIQCNNALRPVKKQGAVLSFLLVVSFLQVQDGR